MKPLRPNSRELAPWPTVQVGKHVGIMFNGSIPVFQTGRVGSNPIIHSIWGYGEIGRRARFRFLCRKAYGFESLYPYHDTVAKLVRL